jgi:hypothetical protein
LSSSVALGEVLVFFLLMDVIFCVRRGGDDQLVVEEKVVTMG